MQMELTKQEKVVELTKNYLAVKAEIERLKAMREEIVSEIEKLLSEKEKEVGYDVKVNGSSYRLMQINKIVRSTDYQLLQDKFPEAYSEVVGIREVSYIECRKIKRENS